MDFDYVTTLLNIPNIDPMELLTLFLLSLFRLGPILALAPFLGAKVAPIMVRVGIMICLSFFLLPTLVQLHTHTLGFDTAFIGYALKELLIGFFLGIFVTIPFFIAQTSGSLVDFTRGSSFMMAQDITMQIQTSPIGQLYNYILIVLFFELSGPFLFIEAIVKSYEIIPADRFISPLFFNAAVPFWKTGFKILNDVLMISIQISAPALLAIMMGEVFLGIANRLAPQVQIAFLGMPIKSLLGLFLLWIGWFIILKQLGNHSMSAIQEIFNLLKSLKLPLGEMG